MKYVLLRRGFKKILAIVGTLKRLNDVTVRLPIVYTRACCLARYHADLELLVSQWSIKPIPLVLRGESTSHY